MTESAAPVRRLEGRDLSIVQRPARTCIDLRGDVHDPRFVRAVQSVTDLAPPAAPCTSASGLLASLLWLGPDQWLVVSDTQEGVSLRASLRQALQSIPSAVTDVGDARIVYSVGGANARELLAQGCPLDLHERVFEPGHCAQTLLAKLSVLIHRASVEPAFDLYVGRSCADHAWLWLQAAAVDFGVEVHGGPQAR